jgi:hypothetical protein
MTSKNARKRLRQRQRRQKARAKAKKQAARQSVAPAASRPVPTRAAVPVATIQRPPPAARAAPTPPRATPPPVAPLPIRVDPPPRSRRRQRITLGVAAALVAAVALVGAALLFVHPGSGDDRAERTAAATRYAAPRPVPPNTSYVETRVLSSGDLKVTHWIHSRVPVSTIHLAQPDVGGLPSLRVSKVVVVGDRTHAVRSGGSTRDYYLGAARHLYVSYTLSGAVTRASHPAGRGLAVITNLEVGGLAGLTESTHSIVGARVLNLACSESTPEALPSPCGTSGRGGWQATLDGSAVDDRVMAQLDLGDGVQQ